MAPYVGPTGGGTRIIVTGMGFGRMGSTDAYAQPHGRRALCRVGASVVNATVDGGQSLRCVTPPSMDGAVEASLSVSINGVDFIGLAARTNPARASGVGVGSLLDDHSGYGGGVGGGLGESATDGVADASVVNMYAQRAATSTGPTLVFRYYEQVRDRPPKSILRRAPAFSNLSSPLRTSDSARSHAS